MKKILSTLSTFLFVSSIATSVFAAGDEATIKKLSSMYKSGMKRLRTNPADVPSAAFLFVKFTAH